MSKATTKGTAPTSIRSIIPFIFIVAGHVIVDEAELTRELRAQLRVHVCLGLLLHAHTRGSGRVFTEPKIPWRNVELLYNLQILWEERLTLFHISERCFWAAYTCKTRSFLQSYWTFQTQEHILTVYIGSHGGVFMWCWQSWQEGDRSQFNVLETTWSCCEISIQTNCRLHTDCC